MNAPVPGSLWKHSKTGNNYEVVTLATLEATTEIHVVYRTVDASVVATWVRPLREWQEPVAWGFGKDMRKAPRFVANIR